MTAIEWTQQPGTIGATWNPTVGCELISPGCQNCYAMKIAHRELCEAHVGLTEIGKHGPRWNGVVRMLPERLWRPLEWKAPRTVFVGSMSDIFHDDVSFEFLAAIFGVMGACQNHTFIVLTKRPARAIAFFRWLGEPENRPGEERLTVCYHALLFEMKHGDDRQMLHTHRCMNPNGPWPLPNVWIGVSVEARSQLGRVHLLRTIPAKLRFLSCEPLIEELSYFALNSIDWVIAGGESGPRSRSMDVRWARELLGRCRYAKVPFFLKQLGSHPVRMVAGDVEKIPISDAKGANMEDWPEDLRIRSWP